MHPKSLKQQLETYLNTASRRYVEEHIDLVDTDLQKFINDCPKDIRGKVIEILNDAEIDLSNIVTSANDMNWWDDYATYTTKTKQYVYETSSSYMDDWLKPTWKVKEIFND